MAVKKPVAMAVFCNTRFVAFHYWPNASKVNKAFSYLETPHRHEFHVTVETVVTHSERDIEFIQLKAYIDAFLHREYVIKHWSAETASPDSCETIAEKIGVYLQEERRVLPTYIRVSEDGENGGEVFYNF